METAGREGSAVGLLDRLREPGTVEALNGLLDRLDALTAGIGVLAELGERAPGMAGLVLDSVDEAVGRAAAEGVDVEARLRDVVELLERLTAPRTVAVLRLVLERIDRLGRLVELADRTPALAAVVIDSADEFVARASEAGLDVDRAITRGIPVAFRLAAMSGPERLDALEALLDSGVLDPDAVRVAVGAGRALAAASGEAPPRVSPWGLVRAGRDHDVQRALGFMLVLAQEFGRRFDDAGGPVRGAEPR